ncbi:MULTISPECIES: hypothetical protein [unclassified Streptomyces]|uniref:hypothetical protein n=1 Tax=Streptomycetaceae TaxID=2062 RepID=UPI002E7A92B2|nr:MULTISPECIES: hypothetical protein [unclassified Streptomyces]MED7947956.1 hypothetical protein [Streptomyces sp. BE303]MEE1823208.1 hypothetical protein [Streptomyces sp. BE20]
MTHNDVARRTARQVPARSLNPRTPACEGGLVPFSELAQRALTRVLPLRALHRDGEGGR